jgi:hypothetical protein
MSFSEETARRRTFALISHPDAGKTTITEKLLLFGGAIQLAGTVKRRKGSRHATSDWMEMAKSSSLVTITTPSLNHSIRGSSHREIGDMVCRKTLGAQPSGKGGRQLRIHQGAHQATESTGWSFWRAACSRTATMSSGSRSG